MKMAFSAQIVYCLHTTITIIIASTSIITAIVVIFAAGSYLGYPFGQFILRFIPDTQPIQTQYQHIGSQSQHAQANAIIGS